MRDARVEEVEHMSDSDDDEDGGGSGNEGQETGNEYTIGIFPNHQSPTYLLLPNKQEKVNQHITLFT